MSLYRRIADTVEAQQWHRIGDLIRDVATPLGDGRLVQAYRRDEILPNQTCALCGKQMQYHGWIDPPLAPVDPAKAAMLVEPLTGNLVAPPVVLPPPPPAHVPVYPETMTRLNSPNRVVNSDQERQQAIFDGYGAHNTPPVPPAPKPVAAVTAPVKAEPYAKERTDLKGVVVCPGDWIIALPGGEVITCPKDQFVYTYVKA